MTHAKVQMKLTQIAFAVLGAVSISMPTSYLRADDCPINSQDPFAKTAVMSSGPYAGHCINTDRYRATSRMTAEQKKLFFSTDDVVNLKAKGVDIDDGANEIVANFLASDGKGNDHFYVAVIPASRVQGAIFQMTGLDPYLPIEHGQIRFVLSKEGPQIILIDQTLAPNREIKVMNDDMVLTISGVRPADHEESYSAVKGLQVGYYDEELQLGTNQHLTLDWIRSSGLSTNEYQMNVTAAQAQVALHDGITLATQRGVTYPYSTLTTSCLNVTFLVLHQMLNTSDDGTLRAFAQSVAPLTALEVLGLINFTGSFIDTLNPNPIAPQATRGALPNSTAPGN